MDTQERSEIREMIHGILSGWEAATIAREDLINAGLKGISDHLGRLNGSVAKHEGIINGNLPHTIVNCVQKDIIQEIRDITVANNTVVKTVQEIKSEKRLEWQKNIQTFMFIVAACGLIVTAYFGWKNNQQSHSIENRVDNLGVPIVTRNGKIMALPDSTQIQFFPNDSLKYTIIKNKKWKH